MTDISIKRGLILINIVLIFWCSILTWQLGTEMPAHIARLSVRSLFDDFLKEQASGQGANSSSATIEANTEAYSRELEVILKELSMQDNVVILVSEAVLSDHVVDITPEIRVMLKRRLSKRTGFQSSEQAGRGDE